MQGIPESVSLINTAHEYVRRGWSVLPLHHVTPEGACSCQLGMGCPTGVRGKHPRRKLWTSADTMSGADVQTHWMDNPHDNIGIRTGTPSGFFVVDIDPKNGGRETWRDLVATHGMGLPITRMAQTGSGGMHIYFAMPDFPISNSAKCMPPGVDIRGTGGLVVAPPSTSGIGGYSWLSEEPIVAAPEWLLEMLRPASAVVDMSNVAQEDLPAYADLPEDEQSRLSSYATATLRRIADEYVSARQGTGDTSLFAATCSALELAQSPWNLMATEDVFNALDGARRMRLALAEDWNGGQTEADFGKRIWRQARSRTAGRGRPVPPDPHAGVQFEHPSVPVGSERVSDGASAADSSQTVQTAGQTDPFAPLDWAEMFTRDWGSIDWMLGKFVERGQQMSLLGDGKAGKSLIMFEWVWRLCSGQGFLGDEPGKPLKVLYADRENSQDDLYRRAVGFGATPQDLANLVYLSFPPFKPLDEDGAAQFLEQVERHSPDVVVLDTVSRFVSGGENDSDTWLKLYRLLHAQLKRMNITGIRLDHFGKDSERGGRGSSAKSQDIDHVWELQAGNSQKKPSEDGSHIVVTTSLNLRRTHTRSGRGTDAFAITRTGHKDAADEDWLPGCTRHEVADGATGDAVWIGAKKIAWRLHQITELPDDAGRPRAQAAHQSRYGHGFDGNLWAEVRAYFREFRDGKGAPLALVQPPDGIDFVA